MQSSGEGRPGFFFSDGISGISVPSCNLGVRDSGQGEDSWSGLHVSDRHPFTKLSESPKLKHSKPLFVQNSQRLPQYASPRLLLLVGITLVVLLS